MGHSPCPMLLTFNTQEALALPSQSLHKDIRMLFEEFEDVFQILKRLPPIRMYDHMMYL